MKTFVLFLCITVTSLFSKTLDEGDFITLEVSYIQDGKVKEKYRSFGLICQDQQLILDGDIYAFSLDDSLLTLWPYSGTVRLFDGMVERRDMGAKLSYRIDGQGNRTGEGVLQTTLKVSKKSRKRQLQRWQGYWKLPSAEIGDFYLIDSMLFSRNMGQAADVGVSSINDSGTASLHVSFNATYSSTLIVELLDSGYLHLTPTNLNRYLNSAIPYTATASVDSIFALGTALRKGKKSVAAQILTEFALNNYFVIEDVRVLEAIEIFKNRSSTYTDTTPYRRYGDLEVLEGDSWLGLLEERDAVASLLSISSEKLSSCNKLTLLLLRSIARSSRRETTEQQRLFSILTTAIIAY